MWENKKQKHLSIIRWTLKVLSFLFFKEKENNLFRDKKRQKIQKVKKYFLDNETKVL